MGSGFPGNPQGLPAVLGLGVLVMGVPALRRGDMWAWVWARETKATGTFPS